ncbi:MAG: HAD-IIB family hydrolase [Syntrophorhabdaceae bacterium]
MKKDRVDESRMRCVAGGPSRRAAKFIIFTDLDGTLLDARTYSFDDAREGLDMVRFKGIPCIICSSKTRAEIEDIRIELDNCSPFIAENGGAIFIPRGSLSPKVEVALALAEGEDGKFIVIRLGGRYADLRAAVVELRDEGFDLKGFGDMTPAEIADLTGLTEDKARLAAKREFDEPFIFRGKDDEMRHLMARMQLKGFTITQGSGYLFHLMGQSDKGKAVSILTDLYRKKYKEVITIGLGDGPNDLPMLREVDIPIIVQKSNGLYDPTLARENFSQADGIGPKGWNKAILKIIH